MKLKDLACKIRYCLGNNWKFFSKSLKFTQTPLLNKIELKTVVQQFTRKLRLIEHFHREDELEEKNSSNDFIIINKLAFNTPRNKDKTLDRNIESLYNLSFPELEKSPKITFKRSNG